MSWGQNDTAVLVHEGVLLGRLSDDEAHAPNPGVLFVAARETSRHLIAQVLAVRMKVCRVVWRHHCWHLVVVNPRLRLVVDTLPAEHSSVVKTVGNQHELIGAHFNADPADAGGLATCVPLRNGLLLMIEDEGP